jgi:hypothetical protein
MTSDFVSNAIVHSASADMLPVAISGLPPAGESLGKPGSRRDITSPIAKDSGYLTGILCLGFNLRQI